jgi:hypothetical protein
MPAMQKRPAWPRFFLNAGSRTAAFVTLSTLA